MSFDRPVDADARRAIAPVICYPNDTLPVPDMAPHGAARVTAVKTDEVIGARPRCAVF